MDEVTLAAKRAVAVADRLPAELDFESLGNQRDIILAWLMRGLPA